MTLRIVPCLLLALALSTTAVSAQQPKPEAELDQIALDVLKEMHNKGAELYNANDSAGCLKVYNATLLTVKPFLKYRPAIQKTIETGIAEAEKTEGVKLQAFKMHELIEKVRADLKAEIKKGGAPEVPLVPKPMAFGGTITFNGKPLADATITIAWGKRAFTTTTNAEGVYTYADPLPPGKYDAIVVGPTVPEKFQSTATSGIILEIGPGKNNGDVDLKSK